MNDYAFKDEYLPIVDETMRRIGELHDNWITACARAVDPRDITHLEWVTRRGSQDEDMVLRGVVIGTWRLVGDGLSKKYVATAPANGARS